MRGVPALFSETVLVPTSSTTAANGLTGVVPNVNAAASRKLEPPQVPPTQKTRRAVLAESAHQKDVVPSWHLSRTVLCAWAWIGKSASSSQRLRRHHPRLTLDMPPVRARNSARAIRSSLP